MSSVILLAIVVAWAVVLVPMLVRRHDAVTESRSVDRFATAMRILSRRTVPPPGSRYVVMPRRPPTMTAPTVAGGHPWAPEVAAARQRAAVRAARVPVTRLPATPAAARSARLARRRRVLSALVGLVAFQLVAAVVAGPGFLVGFVVSALLLGGFVAHLRREARAAQARRARAGAPAAAATPARAQGSRRSGYGAAVAPPAHLAAGSHATTHPTFQAAAPEPAAVDDPDGWEPVPVPVPTYVTAPAAPPRVAPRRPSPPPVRADAALDPEAAKGEIAELDDILEHRRAVND